MKYGGMRLISYRPAVANGPSHYTPCITLGTNLQWENLGRVEPWHCEPGSTENSREEEHEEGGCTTHAAFVSFGCIRCGTSQTAGGEHTNTLTNRAPVEGPASADTIERENTNEGGELRVLV